MKARKTLLIRFLLHPVGKVFVVMSALVVLGGLGVFTYYYSKYSKIIDEKLKVGPFANSSKIFAAPRTIAVGDPIAQEDVVNDLHRAGYSESRGNPMGAMTVRPNEVEIYPGPDSYFEQEAEVIRFAGNKITQIISLRDNTQRSRYDLEPQLMTNLFDRASREKRRLVRFEDIPPVLINAITSAEDKRFFQHSGLDPLGIIRAIWVDLKSGRKDQGASTLTQQLARALWLTNDKSWKRKLPEMLITLELEQKLSKKQIFEFYCNQMYLGRRGSFSINGFGEAAQVYFGKDIRQLTHAEAAMLAGILPNANIYNPFRAGEKVRERRNYVLKLMYDNGHMTEREYAQAVESPLNLSRGASQTGTDAPNFIDMVNDALQDRFKDTDFLKHSYRVYTTLDLELQRAATEAVNIGIKEVDERLKKQKRHRGKTFPDAQVALVAIDPQTGQVKALVGGRNYGVSQLNHVLAKRQPGSIFKPFVYATAMDTAVQGGSRILTAGTTIVDEPTTFWYDNRPYEPSNFEHKFYGPVTIRTALAKSLNVATVKVAEMVGYDNIVAMARRAGLNYDIHPTPAVALGAYEVTPLEMAGAYTIFANQGEYVKPSFISMVRAQSGPIVYRNKLEKKAALDPRVAYLMTNLMEEVVRSGTGAGVRSRGFRSPAAGKTGTSHDGWFAGYTTELLCIVWVGFDDNRQLDLEGAHSAAPIWAEFMKRAEQLREYRNTMAFRAPQGIVTIQIDPLSGMPSTPACPQTRGEVYVTGTQPVGTCPLHGGSGAIHVAGWDNASPAGEVADPGESRRGSEGRSAKAVTASGGQSAPADQPTEVPAPPEKKKGFWNRVLGVFK